MSKVNPTEYVNSSFASRAKERGGNKRVDSADTAAKTAVEEDAVEDESEAPAPARKPAAKRRGR